MAEWLKGQDFSGHWWSNYWIGGATGLMGPVFGTPLQNVKVVMQSTTKDQAFNNSRSAASYLWRAYGISGFYRGFSATLLKDTLFGASFLGHYYTLRDHWGSDRWVNNFAAGATAHCLTWMVFIPIDYVKTRLQRPDNQRTAFQIVSRAVKTKGIGSMWAGVLPACLRTIPVSGIAMTGYEWVRQWLDEEF